MWIAAAVLSAVFAGATAILSKIGIKNTNSDVATAIRTSVVLVMAWVIVFVTGAYKTLGEISAKSLIFLVLSGLATGASWICYFKALSVGKVSSVAAVDKSSVVLSVLFALLVFPEERESWWLKLICLAAITLGTFLMTDLKREDGESKPVWFLLAFLSAVFAAATSILSKIGIENVDSNAATAIRTVVVLVMAWAIVFAKKEAGLVRDLNGKDVVFLVLSGLATGASWLFYYYAIQNGQVSVVVPIDKSSIVLTVAFSALFLKERPRPIALVGLLFLTAGTVCMAVFA